MASSSSLVHLLPAPSATIIKHTNGGSPSLSLLGSCKTNSSTANFHLLHLKAAKKTSFRPSNKKFVVRSDGSEAAGGLLSSFGISTDNPWFGAIAGLAVTLPFIIQRILTFTKQVDIAAGTVEKIADAVGKVADQVEEAAEDMSEALPEGGLKKFVDMVENVAEKTADEAEKVEELMEKVDELTDRIDEFVTQSKSKETEKA